MHRESEPEGDKNSIFMFFSLQSKPVPHQHFELLFISFSSVSEVIVQKPGSFHPLSSISRTTPRQLLCIYMHRVQWMPQGQADPGYQVVGGGGGGGGQNKESHAKFLATPTSLSQTRQTVREVNGIQLFHLTNRFLHVAPFCSQLKVH